MVNGAGRMRNNGEAGGKNELSWMEGSLENHQMTVSEKDRESWQHSRSDPRRNRNNDSNENSRRQRDWEATQGEERKVGRRLALYLPGENLMCHFSSFCVCVDGKEIIIPSGDLVP